MTYYQHKVPTSRRATALSENIIGRKWMKTSGNMFASARYVKFVRIHAPDIHENLIYFNL